MKTEITGTLVGRTEAELVALEEAALNAAHKAIDAYDGPDEINGEWYEDHILDTVPEQYVAERGIDMNELLAFIY